jgi:hypothetical protein
MVDKMTKKTAGKGCFFFARKVLEPFTAPC